MVSQGALQRKLFWFFRIVLSMLLLGLLFWRFDWGGLLQVIQRGQWGYLIGPVLCFWAGFWLSSLRWQAVLQGMQISQRLAYLFLLNLKGYFWNNFLPSTVGGDGYRFLELSRLYPTRRAAVLLDRVYGYLTLLIVHLLLLPALFPLLVGQPVVLAIEAGVIVVMVVFLALWRVRHGWMVRVSAWEHRLAEIGRRAARVLATMERQPGATVARSLLYSGGFVGLNGVALWLYLRALTVQLPFLPVLFASTLGALLGALPLSLNGLGLMELALVLALSPLGVRREEVLLAAFLLRGINLVMAVPGGVLYLWESWRAR